MAILQTPIQALPYPDANSVLRDINDYIRNLATALETKLVMVFSSASERGTDIPTPTEGMLTWLQDVNELHLYNGTAWVRVWPTSPAILTGTTAPVGSQGQVGDIYVQYTA